MARPPTRYIVWSDGRKIELTESVPREKLISWLLTHDHENILLFDNTRDCGELLRGDATKAKQGK